MGRASNGVRPARGRRQGREGGEEQAEEDSSPRRRIQHPHPRQQLASASATRRQKKNPNWVGWEVYSKETRGWARIKRRRLRRKAEEGPACAGKKICDARTNPGSYVGPLPDSPWSGISARCHDSAKGLTAHGRQRLALPLQWRVCINPTGCGEAKGLLRTAEAAGKEPWQVGGKRRAGGEPERPWRMDKPPRRSAGAPTEVAS